ncbi:site-specific integrase [Pedobacter punctiformis]|uniref:Site-specific integrase n=1 Tax=Pedobacter punctiformis TaxID=3004097 RepID=A0ABT4L8K7_9SPHI|nr:site-specific integrase [Pedobacter sp. HCMS5-2]MCZ4244258.1 site-specific integrase [Pedobacter sp. HCMS5-2]
MEKSFGLRFFLKNVKNKKNDEKYVYIKITVDGKQKELSLKRTWNPDNWNQNKGRASGTKEEAAALNSFIESITAKVYQTKKAFFDNNRQLTAKTLMNVAMGIEPVNRTILNVFSEHIKSMQLLVGIEYKQRTVHRYKTAYNHLSCFIKSNSATKDIELKAITYDFISDYYYWLRKEKKCSYNSTVKYLILFKRITIICQKKGWINIDPFIGFKTSPKEISVSPLKDAELRAIETCQILRSRLLAVRDIFLFCCYTGLAYVDVKNLKYSNLFDGIDGNKWIEVIREKTAQISRIPLLPIALDIMILYKNKQLSLGNEYVLPVLSNQKMNKYLKEIAELSGIKRNLTFHIARHTFATTITLSNGVPIETVSKMLGHRSLKQTQHYARVLDEKISSEMDSLKNKLKIPK